MPKRRALVVVRPLRSSLVDKTSVLAASPVKSER